MIIISPFIKVGVSTPTFCDFYEKIKDYIYQLYRHDNYFKETDFELVRLNIYVENEWMYEEYYLFNGDNYFKIYFKSNIHTKTGNWSLLEKISFNEITFEFPFTYDIDFFIKNN